MPRFPAVGSIAVVFVLSVVPGSRAIAASSKTKKSPTTVAPTTSAPTVGAKPAKATNVKVDVEQKLARLQQQTSPNLKVGVATCPAAMAKIQIREKAEASKPVTFRCTIGVEGVTVPYDVEIRDGGFLKGGSFVMSRAKAIIDISKVVAGVIAQLDTADRSKAKVSCGPAKVVVASIGDPITCIVDYGAAGKQTLAYTVKDLDGTILLNRLTP